jgi:C4-dicarboxylate transporter, DctQ subunit
MNKFITAVYRTEELFIGYSMLFIALVATIQVILRYLFGVAYDWIDEGARYMTIMITFVGAGVCVRYGAHFSMDALIQYSPDRIKHLLKLAANLISAFIMAVLFYYSWVQILKLQQFGATTPSFRIPMFIPYLPIGIFTIVIALRFLTEAFKHARAMALGLPFDKKGGH